MSVTELIGAAIGCTLLALGVASMVAWTLRRRPADRVLLLFGLWCSLYGARLLAEQRPIVTAIGGSSQLWEYFRTFVTYTDGIPETQNPKGDFFDLERLKGWLTSTNGHDAAQFADGALVNLRRWRGGAAFDDDRTFVVARFTEQA